MASLARVLAGQPQACALAATLMEFLQDRARTPGPAVVVAAQTLTSIAATCADVRASLLGPASVGAAGENIQGYRSFMGI